MHLDLLLPVFVVLVFLPQLSPFVDCRTACTKCRVGTDATEVLQVYCSMCAECRARLKKKQSTPEKNPRLRQGPVRSPNQNIKDILSSARLHHKPKRGWSKGGTGKARQRVDLLRMGASPHTKMMQRPLTRNSHTTRKLNPPRKVNGHSSHKPIARIPSNLNLLRGHKIIARIPHTGHSRPPHTRNSLQYSKMHLRQTSLPIVKEQEQPLEGDIEVRTDVPVREDVPYDKDVPTGYVPAGGGEVTVGEDIPVGGGVPAVGDIPAGGDIPADGDISPGGDITAGGGVLAGADAPVGEGPPAGGNAPVGEDAPAGGNAAGGDASAVGDIPAGGDVPLENNAIGVDVLVEGHMSTGAVGEKNVPLEGDIPLEDFPIGEAPIDYEALITENLYGGEYLPVGESVPVGGDPLIGEQTVGVVEGKEDNVYMTELPVEAQPATETLFPAKTQHITETRPLITQLPTKMESAEIESQTPSVVNLTTRTPESEKPNQETSLKLETTRKKSESNERELSLSEERTEITQMQTTTTSERKHSSQYNTAINALDIQKALETAVVLQTFRPGQGGIQLAEVPVDKNGEIAHLFVVQEPPQTISDGCPTPPDCESEEERIIVVQPVPPVSFVSVTTTTSTTTTTTTTTSTTTTSRPPPTLPPVTPQLTCPKYKCKKKSTICTTSCGCPVCPCPMPSPVPQPVMFPMPMQAPTPYWMPPAPWVYNPYYNYNPNPYQYYYQNQYTPPNLQNRLHKTRPKDNKILLKPATHTTPRYNIEDFYEFNNIDDKERQKLDDDYIEVLSRDLNGTDESLPMPQPEPKASSMYFVKTVTSSVSSPETGLSKGDSPAPNTNIIGSLVPKHKVYPDFTKPSNDVNDEHLVPKKAHENIRKSNDYLYFYIGVPKDVSTNRNNVGKQPLAAKK